MKTNKNERLKPGRATGGVCTSTAALDIRLLIPSGGGSFILKQIWHQLLQNLAGRSKSQPRQTAFKGAPTRPRTKTYSSDGGHVYQYLYRGYLPIDSGREYIFAMKCGSTLEGTVSIQLQDEDFAECARRAQRPLLDAERYAVAKMTLFEAFDQGKVRNVRSLLQPSADDTERHLRTLGRIV